jgi:hypothetical protein
LILTGLLRPRRARQKNESRGSKSELRQIGGRNIQNGWTGVE